MTYFGSKTSSTPIGGGVYNRSHVRTSPDYLSRRRSFRLMRREARAASSSKES